MKQNLLEIIDFERINTLLQGFNKTTGFVTAILDLEGNILSKSGWRQICTEFHRVNPKTSKRCKISDTELANKLAAGEKYHFYKCLNGLVDVAVPMVFKGEHIANLFTGQFFFEEPDRNFFIKQASKYGFDKKKYLMALDQVPVIPEKKVKPALDFLLNMTELIAEMSVQQIEQNELNNVLKESEEKFKLAFLTSPDSVNINRLEDGMYIDINDSFTEITGYTKEETIGRTSSEIDIWLNSEDRLRLVAGLKKSGKVKNLEAKFKLKDGRIIDGLMSAAVISINNIPHILSITRDITEFKSAEKALRVSEIKYRSFFENSMDAILLTGPDGKIYSANPAACKMFGYSKNEIIQLGREGIVDLSDSRLPILLSQRKAKGKAVGEITMLRKYKTPFQVELSSAIFINAENEPLTSMIIRDITDRKKVENEINKLNEELEQKVNDRTNELSRSQEALLNLVEDLNEKSNELEKSSQSLESKNKELETFTYSVSHDLKAPLRGIDGYSQILLKDYESKLDSEGQRFLHTIRNSALQMNQLINDLLEYSRLERQTIIPSAVQLKEVVDILVAQQSTSQNFNKISIVADIPSVEIFTDRNGLTLSLRNLIENAIKFSQKKRNPKIEIGYQDVDTKHLIFVKDNGIGFNMKFHDRIFQIFQRLQRSEDYEGTGIGLAMVTKALERLNGKVWAESKLGKETIFYIELPKINTYERNE